MTSVFIGNLKMELTKDGRRYLKGWQGNIPLLGFEDKKMKNKFHVTVDAKKLNWMTTQDKKAATKADVVEE